jgi:antitoxin (DNA-binding transcriptional repressor) of toxin-antitoxin stability system
MEEDLAPVKKVSQSEARKRFAALVKEAMAGATIVVEHRGKATVMLVAADARALRARPVKAELTDELRRQFLAENELVEGRRAEDAIEEALFSGSLKVRIEE